MAKTIDGTIVRLGPATRRRGKFEYATIELRDSDGRPIVWRKMGMDREIAEELRIGEAGRFYFSTAFGTLYALRWLGEPAHFQCFSANPLALLMSIGMVFAGLATSVFLFPLLVALAGVAGIFVCLDARRARSRFKRDEKANPAPPRPPMSPAARRRERIHLTRFHSIFPDAHQPFITRSELTEAMVAAAAVQADPNLSQEDKQHIRDNAGERILREITTGIMPAFVASPATGGFFVIPTDYWVPLLKVREMPWRSSDRMQHCFGVEGQDESMVGQLVLIAVEDGKALIADTPAAWLRNSRLTDPDRRCGKLGLDEYRRSPT